MAERDKITVVNRPGGRVDPEFEKQVKARYVSQRKFLEKQMVRIALGKPALGETETRIQMHRENRFLGTLHGRARIRSEASFGEITDFLPIDFFKVGYLASRAVGRILCGPIQGSGFLVAPGVLMTNEHIISTGADARRAVVYFETVSHIGQQSSTFPCKFDPDRFLYVNKEHDFTLVAVEDNPQTARHLVRLGWHPMLGTQGKILIGHPITIVQYPEGLDKTVVLHNSHLLQLDNQTAKGRDPFFWYRSDTEGGSSGSPVFDREWRVIGIHHAAIHLNEGRIGRSTENVADEDDKPAYVANEGVRTSVIVDDLLQASQKGSFETKAMAPLAEGLLELWKSSESTNVGLSAASIGTVDEVAEAGIPEDAAFILPEVPGSGQGTGTVKSVQEAGRSRTIRSGPDQPSISISITIDGRRHV